MKIKHAFFALPLLAAATGCQKLFDYIPSPQNGNTDYKTCAIKKINVAYADRGDTAHYVFTYNKLGDPVSVINDKVSTGNPNMLFKYDKYNRLREMIRPYTNGSYESWNRYGYNNKNQIVRDTSFAFGLMTANGPEETTRNFAYTDYVYDAQNRIVGETDSIFNAGAFFFLEKITYEYDSKGNRVVFQTSYDNKLNPLRTNKIWMFVTKNYSVNNPFVANSYNSNSLPLSFVGRYPYFGIIMPLEGGLDEVTYDCK